MGALELRRRHKRWLRCRVRIVVLEVEIYGRVVSESLRHEIEHEDTQSSGCLAADARVAIGTYHLLADQVRPHRNPDRSTPWWSYKIGPPNDMPTGPSACIPVRPSPTQGMRY